MNTKARSTITKEANGLTFVASAYVDDEGATSGLCVKLLDDSGEPVNIDCEAVITAKTTN
ncbi:MAG: hypothetical protein GY905_13645, partial [Gammaproteobacteria bacterium]|nr:hypothetical protein [Gammaproteobacteria bacterium]